LSRRGAFAAAALVSTGILVCVGGVLVPAAIAGTRKKKQSKQCERKNEEERKVKRKYLPRKILCESME
jgi:hypothetical protein